MKNIYAVLTVSIIMTSGSIAIAAPVYHATVPPSVTLTYKVTALYNGLNLSGNSIAQWKTDYKSYSIRNKCTVTFFGDVLNSTSSGHVSKAGLAPSSYSETKLRKKFSASINQATGFFKPSDDNDNISFSGQAQDHSSVIWQLSAIANYNKVSFSPGHSYAVQVIGHRGVGDWTFYTIRNESLSTPAGRFQTAVLSGSNGKNQTMTIWFAKDRYYYPVQLYFRDNNLETRQTISNIQ